MTGIRQRLKQGDLLLGQIVLEFFTPGLGPMFDACGLDFVIYDMEHGRCDIGLLEQMIASCRGGKVVPMVRVPDLNFAPLARVLDVGANTGGPGRDAAELAVTSVRIRAVAAAVTRAQGQWGDPVPSTCSPAWASSPGASPTSSSG